MRDLAHHPDDGPPPTRPNPTLARDIVFVLLVTVVACIGLAAAMCVEVG
jgi:hypothetical protein